METSLQIKILLIIAAGAAISGFAVSWLASIKAGQLIAWIKATFPEKWNALPNVQRQWLRRAAIEHLRHGGLGNNEEFAHRYDRIKRLRNWTIALVIAGCAAISTVILGTQFGTWTW